MKQQKLPTIAYWISFALLVGIVMYLSFQKLDVKYVDPWDEARHGVNAYEMLHGGSLFQNTYLRQADYYNLKPPLSMWGIMLGMLLFSNPVFALRFCSALCYVLLAVATGLFARKYGKCASLFAIGFLCINTTAFQAHMIRSGDADSLFVLLFSLAMFFMLLIKKDVRFLYGCGLCFSLAFLAKSYHAGMIALIGGLFLILTGFIRKLKWKDWLIFLATIFVPILLWALLRFRVDGATFFVQMWETDVLHRTSGVLQNNPAPFGYYLEYFFVSFFDKARWKVTSYAFALGICVIGFLCYIIKNVKQKTKLSQLEEKEEVLGFFLWIVLPVLAFSAVTNKLLWYVYPSLVAILIAAGILVGKLIASDKLPVVLRVVVAVVVAGILSAYAWDVTTITNAQTGNEFQLLLQEVAKAEQLRGLPVFVDYNEDNPNWSQQDVFVAEAFGDFNCLNGGVEEAQKEKKAILFMTNDQYEKMFGADASEEMLLETLGIYKQFQLIAKTADYVAIFVETAND